MRALNDIEQLSVSNALVFITSLSLSLSRFLVPFQRQHCDGEHGCQCAQAESLHSVLHAQGQCQRVK